LIIQQLTR